MKEEAPIGSFVVWRGNFHKVVSRFEYRGSKMLELQNKWGNRFPTKESLCSYKKEIQPIADFPKNSQGLTVRK